MKERHIIGFNHRKKNSVYENLAILAVYAAILAGCAAIGLMLWAIMPAYNLY